MIEVNTILNAVIAASVVGGLAKLFQIEKRLTKLETEMESFMKACRFYANHLDSR
jgi:hypothetical protein